MVGSITQLVRRLVAPSELRAKLHKHDPWVCEIIPMVLGYELDEGYYSTIGSVKLMCPRVVRTAAHYKKIRLQQYLSVNDTYNTLDNMIEDLYDNREKQIADTESIENTLRKYETDVGKCREETQDVKESLK